MSTSIAVILAAGLGTRLKSAVPKPLHRLGGVPMVRLLLEACEAAGFGRIVVVAGPEPAFDPMRALVAPHTVVVQAERLGTAHAALMAEEALSETSGEAIILYADVPLVSAATLAGMVATRLSAGARLALLGFRPADPAQYGRIVLEPDGTVARIVEWRDATDEERAIGLCNAGLFCAPAADLLRWLKAVGNDNAKGEYYLTDIVALARAEGVRVALVEAPAEEVLGINSRAELAAAEAALQRRLRARAMADGVTLIAPETVFLAADTALAPDVTVHPHVVFGPGVRVGAGAVIQSFSHLESCTVEAGATVGPFARLRPGASVGEGAHVGNFVELKAARLGPGAKANHLAYLGDAEIGAGANVGAGTITCNYDGFGKYRTVIGPGAFIGSNTSLVAPVRVGAGAIIAAGSTITEDVGADSVAFGRARQVEKPGAAPRFREAAKARKARAKEG
ncbi:bifunctional UDP-N-acetylglucosamine diphosphorylase/glucosamine-1-phosphate N-acetyltransferase GlmU [Elioraea tepida]|uniref:Bifunctional protein GlmU n=1 Tax=Elioraea tepida TaxID=2843330 RepID=A0A975YIR5_9PROT|nr:bifunctional UDP-N-acetylglucosamine diphosphorylase/glucosamine-1-phosphate N-acetyltransferase GlmU [Elioraea tepida]QXM24070.1 bifunctional UDP-N-acetylglucosamine diphosphorylase/glucosamine-1-phosphate N-acetyltransferase GlmU [Elioraea tepida]